MFVEKDVRKNLLRRGIGDQNAFVNGKARCRRALGQMKKREELTIALFVDAKIVEPSLARREPVGLERRAVRIERREKRSAPPPEQLCVALLVGRVAQVKAT